MALEMTYFLAELVQLIVGRKREREEREVVVSLTDPVFIIMHVMCFLHIQLSGIAFLQITYFHAELVQLIVSQKREIE